MTMLQYACLALALFVLPSSVLGNELGDIGRNLLQNKASSNAKADNGGSATSRSVASVKTFEEGQTVVSEAVAEAFTKVKNGEDASSVADAQAKSVATAVARVWASALVEVEVQGSGEACGNAEASGTANAIALAKAYAEAIASVSNENGVVADAEAISESVSQATASAAASAQAQGCTTAGTVVAAQDTFAEAIVTVFAEALAAALAEVVNGNASAESLSEAESGVANESTNVEQQSNVDVMGMGSGSTEATADANVNRDGGSGETPSNGEMGAMPMEEEVIPPCVDVNYGTCCRSVWTRRRSCRCNPRERCNLRLLSFDDNIPTWISNDDESKKCVCPEQTRGRRGI